MKKTVEITSIAKSSLVALKSLRSNCVEKIGEDFNPFDNQNGNIDSKSVDEIVKNPLEKIILGIEEAEIILTFLDHLDVIEANTMKLNSMIMRLSEENSWLRDEINVSQNRLSEAEEKNIDLNNKIEDYKLKLELIKYDEPMTQSYSSNQLADSINLTESTISGQLNEETYYEPNRTSNANKQPAGSNQSETGTKQTTTNNNASGSAPGYNYDLPEHLKTLHSLITEYSSNGRFEVATALCKQAIQNEMKSIESKKKILTSNTSNNDPSQDGNSDNSPGEYYSLDIATLQNILALVYKDQGNFAQAGELLNKSLGIREKILGPDHPLIAITLNNIAIIYAKTGKFREAESMCKRALSIREQHLGNNHPDVAKQLFNLALLIQNQGRFEDVEQYYKKALQIYADNFGPDNFNVMKTRNNIAYVHLKQSNFMQAEIIFKELLTCWHERLSVPTSNGAKNGPEDRGNDSAGVVEGPKKPLWMLVEDKGLLTGGNMGQGGVGFGGQLKNNAEVRKILPVYTRVTELTKEEFDVFSTSISYLIRAYRGQNKLTEADLLDDWLSQSMKYFDSMEKESHKFSRNRSRNINITQTSSHASTDFGDGYYYPFEQPFSPLIQSESRNFTPGNHGFNASNNSGNSNNPSDQNGSSYSRYSIRRIGNKISNKFKSLRNQSDGPDGESFVPPNSGAVTGANSTGISG